MVVTLCGLNIALQQSASSRSERCWDIFPNAGCALSAVRRPSLSLSVSLHRACGEHSNIQGMSSFMKSFTLADRVTTKTGCRWSEQSGIYSRFPSRPTSTRSPRFGGFISLPPQLSKSATVIVQSPSSGGGLTDVFSSHLVGLSMVGWTTGHQSRFVRSPVLPPSLSHSSSTCWRRDHRTMTANHDG